MAQSTVELREQLALTRHINKYGQLADAFAWEEIAKCFTEDTVFEFIVPSDIVGQDPMNLNAGTIKGRPDTAKALAVISDKFKRTQHNILNMDFDIDPSGTTATGKANIFWGGVSEDNGRYFTAQTGSRYKWKFTKNVDGSRWQTAHTQVEIIWLSSAPVDGFKLVNML